MKATFFGSGSGKPEDMMYNLMMETAKRLAMEGATIVTGAFGGSGMEAPAVGAKAVEGESIGYAMLGMPGNPYLSEWFDVNIFVSANAGDELQFTTRLGKLLESDVFVLGADGGIGSLVEFSAWANLNSKIWKKAGTPKRLAILWPDAKETSPFFWPIFAAVKFALTEDVLALVHWCQSPQEVVDFLL